MNNKKEACESCKANGNDHCGNEWCHTVETEDVGWITECNLCGAKHETTWKEAVNERNACCGTLNVQIYHKTSIKKKQLKREVQMKEEVDIILDFIVTLDRMDITSCDYEDDNFFDLHQYTKVLRKIQQEKQNETC